MKNQKTQQAEIIYGAHSILECIKAKKRKIISIYTTNPEPKSFQRIKSALPKNKGITIHYTDRKHIAQICQSDDHMGVVAFVGDFVYRSKPFEASTHPLILMLDCVQDVKNMGAILRSAYCSGFTGVIIPASNNAKVNAAAMKSSAGLAEHLDIQVSSSLKNTVSELKNAGYTIYAAYLGGQDIRNVEIKRPLCIIIGNEERGISPDLAKMCQKVMIPQISEDVSYNASVAAGILMNRFSFF